jgi:hypothetical protein
MPADILGKVYEQFLGKVIRLTDGHQAKVEEKPEVRKAGGVHYTPTYIVEYIVKHTIGELIKDKTPKEVSLLQFLDPACGSGSFLIGAYQYLLDWHLQWYSEHLAPLIKSGISPNANEITNLLPSGTKQIPVKGKKSKQPEYSLPIYQISETDWKLTTDEKKRILIKNIYGVDIDPQAVEVTKLSLLLKVLEGERSELIDKQLKITAERVLPSLHKNIKCGNSLIGSDILSQTTLEGEEIYKINPFDWDREFSEIMQGGGFDAVIGNPPYVRQESIKEMKEYFSSRYQTYQGTADLYVYFVERGMSLLRDGGYFSYIVANKWMRAAYGKPLRKWLKERQIEEIIDFGDLPVFEQATTYPCILRMSKKIQDNTIQVTNVDTLSFHSLDEYILEHGFILDQQGLDESGWALVNEKEKALLDKIRAAGIPLGEYVDGKIFYGIKTGLNKAFVIDEDTKNRLIAEDPKSAELIKPFLAGRDIKRYQPLDNHGQYLIFTRHGIDIDQYPAIKGHLLQFKQELTPRPDNYSGTDWKGRKPGKYKWYEIQDTIDYWKEFEKDKIVYPEICHKNEFTFDTDGYYTNNKCFIIPTTDKYLLGVLSSNLFFFLFKKILPQLQGGFFMPAYVKLKDFPIRLILHSDNRDETLYHRIVNSVTNILALSKNLAIARLPLEKDQLKRQIDATDREIDKLVYQLYELTEDEIKIIEESV